MTSTAVAYFDAMNVKHIAAVSCAAMLIVSSCGSDEGSASESNLEEFCEMIRTADEQDDVDLGDDFDAGIAQLEEIRDAAPSAVRDDIDVLIGKFQEMEDLEAASTGDDEADFAAAFEIILDPEFIAASERLEQFGVDECGLPPSDDDGFSITESDDDADSGPVEAPVSEDGLITEAANVPDPLFDPFFDDDVVDPAVVSIDGAQYFLDVNHTDAPWRTRLGSWSNGNSEFGVGGVDITEPEALEICAAMQTYLSSLDFSGAIVVNSYSQDDDGSFGPETQVLSGTAADGC
ncbi:hypothetical protein YM304_36190 [Ilumatobacter coccineus YM16-304]|uniref:Uncharacterized protein n=2 Tax=Ilumatobacter coccineus TaxID=467094 RepID=A0A6C7EC89_ILUCY|nr:hypothetical protein YM304_36190 [Ilumatobacter coccineus YM16-304]